jgi:hypothetical protein
MSAAAAAGSGLERHRRAVPTGTWRVVALLLESCGRCLGLWELRPDYLGLRRLGHTICSSLASISWCQYT